MRRRGVGGRKTGLLHRLVFRPRAVELLARQAAAVILVGLVEGVTKSADALGFRAQHIAAIIDVDRLVNDVRGIGLRIRLGRGRSTGLARRRGLGRRRAFLRHGCRIRAGGTGKEENGGGQDGSAVGCVGMSHEGSFTLTIECVGPVCGRPSHAQSAC